MLDVDIDRHDKIQFAAGVSFDPLGYLEDAWTSQRGRPNDSAVSVLRHLNTPTSISDLVGRVELSGSVDSEHVEQTVHDVLLSLDDRAALLVHRPLRSWLRPIPQALRLVEMLKLHAIRRPARRYPPTMAGIARAVGRQSVWPGLVLTILTALLLIAMLATGTEDSWYPAFRLSAVLLVVGGLHALLLFCHEAGHLIATKVNRVDGVVAVSRGLRIGLVMPILSDRRARVTTALSGPVAATVVAALISVAALSTEAVPWEFLQYSFALGLMHLVSLGPWASDGRMLWRPTVGEDDLVVSPKGTS